MQLEFESENHLYTLNGRRVPSVTQVLDPHNDWHMVPEVRLHVARMFGRNVHHACHLLVQDQLDFDSLDEATLSRARGAEKFLTDTGFVVTESEMLVASPYLGVAGTLDLRGFFPDDPRPWILDWKSIDVLPRSVGPQTAAYEKLLRDYVRADDRFKAQRRIMDVAHRRGCVLLVENDFIFRALHNKDDWNLFLSALNIHQWKTRAWP